MTKTALVARDRLYRSGIGRLLESTRFELIAMGGSVNEVVTQCSDAKPELILLNLDAGRNDVKGLISQIRRWSNDARVVVIAPFEGGDVLNEAFNAVADGTLHRDISADALIDVLAVVMSGEPVYLGLHRTRARTDGKSDDGQHGHCISESGLMGRLSERV